MGEETNSVSISSPNMARFANLFEFDASPNCLILSPWSPNVVSHFKSIAGEGESEPALVKSRGAETVCETDVVEVEVSL